MAGLLSFASPCVLPLVPPYLAYMGGVSIEELREERPRLRLAVLGAALCFVAGFSTVFVALGATASVIGQAVSAYLGWLGYVAGVLVALMGLHFLHVIRIPLLDRTARVGVDAQAGRAAWRLCDRACLRLWLEPLRRAGAGGNLADRGRERQRGRGRAFIVCLFARHRRAVFGGGGVCRRFMRWSARFRSRMAAIEKAMGALLVIAGVLIFTGQMPAIANWLIDTFPALGKIG